MKKLKQSEVKEYRENMLKEQGGKCAFCGEDCVKPCLDHAHRDPHKDKIRGVICNSCNIFMGKLENASVRLGVGVDGVRKFSWKVAMYITYDYSDADWHPSKRKSEVIEFKKLTAQEQVETLILLGAYKEETLPTNVAGRVKLYKKLQAKT